MNSQVDPFWVSKLIQIGGLVSSFAVVYKFIVKPLRRNVFSKFGEFYKQVGTITTELKPNGGNSLRDQVDKANTGIAKLHQRQLSFLQFDINGIYEMNAKGECVWVNRAYLDIVKRHPDEVMGAGWHNMVHESDRERVIREYASAVADKRDCFLHLKLVDSEGQEIECETRALRMIDGNGSLLGHFGYVMRCDQPPAGCRWCREIEDLTSENYRLMRAECENARVVSTGDAVDRLKKLGTGKAL